MDIVLKALLAMAITLAIPAVALLLIFIGEEIEILTRRREQKRGLRKWLDEKRSRSA
jgi:hypothetical protein